PRDRGLAYANGTIERVHLLAVHKAGGVGRNRHAGETDVVIAEKVDGRDAFAGNKGGVELRGKGRDERRHVREFEVVVRRERRVESRVAREVGARVLGLLLENGDFCLRADEADVEAGALDNDPGASDSDDWGCDPGPFDATHRAE